MNPFLVSGHAPVAVASCVPRRRERTSDCEFAADNGAQLFVRTTGVRERRVAPAGITSLDLCLAAAKQLLGASPACRDKIGVLVCVTQSPDYRLPGNAVIAQSALGLNESLVAFDVNLGCSGYVYGLSVVSAMMTATGAEYGLLLAGDVSSRACSEGDPQVYPLFGDAGSATLMARGDSQQRLLFGLGSDGDGKDAIIVPAGGARQPCDARALAVTEQQPGVRRSDMHLRMDGLKVYDFAVDRVPALVSSLLEAGSMSVDDIDRLVMHQASFTINEVIRRKLGFAAGKTPSSLGEFGNTSSASIPLTLAVTTPGELDAGVMLLAGFGVGLSWGAVLMEHGPLHIHPLLELGEEQA